MNDNENSSKDSTLDNKLDDSNLKNDRDKIYFFNKSKNIVYYFLGVFEVLLMFRLFFKALNASTANAFVSIIYGLTNVLVAPFVGIFNIITANNAVTYVIEPATIIAMIVYSLLAYGVIRLIKVSIINN